MPGGRGRRLSRRDMDGRKATFETGALDGRARDRNGDPHFDKILVAAIRLTSGTLRSGDVIRIEGHSTDLEQVVASIQIEHLSVAQAKQGDEIGMRVRERVHKHDKVFKVED